jgi:hypothetical protein
MKSIWNKNTVKDLLVKSDLAVEKAILVVYKGQTEDEKRTEDVKYHNNKGFLPYHSIRGTYYAKYILSGKHLSGKHLETARKMSLKYTRQLLLAIKEKEGN